MASSLFASSNKAGTSSVAWCSGLKKKYGTHPYPWFNIPQKINDYYCGNFHVAISNDCRASSLSHHCHSGSAHFCINLCRRTDGSFRWKRCAMQDMQGARPHKFEHVKKCNETSGILSG